MDNYLAFRWINCLVLSIVFINGISAQTSPNASLKDSPTTIIGFNHIGISVSNLDKMVDFYKKATKFEIVKRERVSNHKNADKIYGHPGVAYERVTFKAPNMLLELTQFKNQQNATVEKMLPQGPGMTHTCFQSPSWESGYQKFQNAKIDMLSRGDTPVDLGGYGVTYAYGYDPEGNMLEMEQLSKTFLNKTQMDSLWVKQNKLWMTQVAIVSPNLEKLAQFYRNVLGFAPNRKAKLADNPRLDDIINGDNLVIHATWFKMDGYGKMLELMQYEHPITSAEVSKKDPTDLGYTFSLEVSDIQLEYVRMKQLGVSFLSEPQILGEFWTVLAHDADGNVFSLRQSVTEASSYSMRNFKY